MTDNGSLREEGVPRPLRAGATTGRRRFDGASLEEYAAPRGTLGRIARRAGVVVPALDAVATGDDPLPARIYEDKWIVDCPECGSAAFVWPEFPTMLCAYCFNAKVGGLWRRVALPTAEDMEDAEEVLGHRHMPHERNWTPAAGETPDDLRLENADHGVPAPPPKRPRPGSEGLEHAQAEREKRRKEKEKERPAPAAAQAGPPAAKRAPRRRKG